MVDKNLIDKNLRIFFLKKNDLYKPLDGHDWFIVGTKISSLDDYISYYVFSLENERMFLDYIREYCIMDYNNSYLLDY